MIEYRYALNQLDRLPALMAELVGRRVAVLAATGGTISAQAAKAATTTVPIVFTTGDDPVKVGLVASLNRPGGNLTGVSVFTARLGPKRLGLIHEMVPKASPIAVLVNPKNPDSGDEAKDILEAARGLGVQVFVVSASREDDLDGAFATLVQRKARALIIGADTVFASLRTQIVVHAARHSLPTMSTTPSEVEAGGQMGYGANIPGVYRQARAHVGKILKGATPANLPVELPTAFDLVINLKTARALHACRMTPLLRSPAITAISALLRTAPSLGGASLRRRPVRPLIPPHHQNGPSLSSLKSGRPRAWTWTR